MSLFRRCIVNRKIADLFGADLRSLAALRIAIASIIIADLIRRSQDLVAHYTDFGVLPRAALIAGEEHTRWRVSVHLANGTWEFQALLFAIAGVLACALLVGHRTRLVTVASWFLLLSLHSRNPFVLDAGDVLLRLTLFWAIFLPWGARWSLDSLRRTGGSETPERVVSAATFAYTAQIVFVYWFSVFHKTGTEWHDGSAVYYALSFDQMARPLGQYLLQFPALLKMLTHGVLWFEILGPLLLLSPLWTGPLRTAGVIGFVLMHVGIGLCINLGVFTWTASLCMLGLLPAWFWSALSRRVKTDQRFQVVMYYDRECSFCLQIAQKIRKAFLLPECAIAPAQTDASIEADMRFYNSWVAIDHKGAKYFKFDALHVLAASSRFFWPVAPVLRYLAANALGERIYDAIAKDPHAFVQASKSYLTPVGRYGLRLGLVPNLLLLLILAYVFAWNVNTLPNSSFRFSERSRAIGELLSIDQGWNMFASPPRVNGWLVIPGKLKSGAVVDLSKDGADVTWERPVSGTALFPSYRWWKYLFTLWGKADQNSWRNYAQYICRSWNKNHGQSETLEELRFVLTVEAILPNNQKGVAQRFLLLEHECATGR